MPLTKKAKEAMGNWLDLNAFLRTADETQASLMLDAEKKGKRRLRFLMRIHSRLNKERAVRERRELAGGK